MSVEDGSKERTRPEKERNKPDKERTRPGTPVSLRRSSRAASDVSQQSSTPAADNASPQGIHYTTFSLLGFAR